MVGHHVGEELAIDLFVEGIHFVVVVPDLAGGGDVAVDEGVQAAAEHIHGAVGHAGYVNERLEGRLVAHGYAYLGDALGVVADALKFG